MSAAFNFDAYKLAEVHYKKILDEKSIDEAENNDNSDQNGKHKITITTNIGVNNEDKNKYRIQLIVSVDGPSQAKINIYGFFTGNNFYDDTINEQDELLPIGIALLLPIARSILASISAQDGSTPFLLPDRQR